MDLLRLILAYCLGDRGLRSTAAWATAIGLANLSNVALLQRLRRCGDWLALLVGEALAAAAPQASRGRLIRIIDATTVPKAGAAAKKGNKLWRIHSAFDLPRERFGHFELTDQHGGETLDRIPVVKGEIRIADRAYLMALLSRLSARHPSRGLGGLPGLLDGDEPQSERLAALASNEDRPVDQSAVRRLAELGEKIDWLALGVEPTGVSPCSPTASPSCLSRTPTC